MSHRNAYRLAYGALVGALLFACAPRTDETAGTQTAAAPEQPAAFTPDPNQPVAPVTVDGPAPSDVVQPMSAPVAPSAAAPQAAQAPAASAVSTATPDELVTGRAVYARACVMCHGPNGAGIPGGPTKLTGLKDFAAIKRVTAGGSANMPPMQGLLAPDEIDAVSKFIAAGLPTQ